MASAVPRIGTCSYGGFTFPVETETTGFDMRPVPSEDGRTVKWTEFTITLRTIITGLPTDPTVLDARRKLKEWRGDFVYQDLGVGGLSIDSRRSPDVNFGPKPQELSFRQIGGRNACELIWRCSICVPDCPDASRSGPVEISTTWEYQVDREGYTSRTVSGFIEIAQGFTAAGTLRDNPDSYRGDIQIGLIAGCRRTWGPWVISADRRRLSFSITDEEIGANIPPPGVIEIKANHSVSSSAKGLTHWSSVIDAEYTVARVLPDPLSPVKHFIGVLCRDRIGATASGLGKDITSIIPVSFSMKELDIFGRRRQSFTFAYTFIKVLKEILQASSLWRPVPGSNWQAWYLSLANDSQNPFGHMRIGFRVGDDMVSDPCEGLKIQTPATPVIIPNPIGPPRQDKWIEEAIRELSNKPTPDKSWVSYESELWLETDSGTVPVSRLPSKPLDDTWAIFSKFASLPGKAWNVLDDLAFPTKLPARDGGKLENISNDSFARRVKPTVFVYLRGKAMRAQYPVPIPRLVTVAGITAEDSCRLDRGEGFSQGIKMSAGESPVYYAAWNIRYQLNSDPGRALPIPPNPLIDPS